MNSKIITILLLCLGNLVMVIGTVNAVTLGNSRGADPIRRISIEKVEFNIPEGYVKNNKKNIINETQNHENYSFVISHETYKNSNG